MADIVTGTADLGVGYIELPLDGTDYSGRYTTVTKGRTYRYDIDMRATRNLTGKEQYSLYTEWSDDQGHSGQWEIFRTQGETVHISNGHARVQCPYIEKTEPV